jgi:hypothetical protein
VESSVAASTRITIPPGQERLLLRLLSVDPRRAGGWRVLSVTVAGDHVEARYGALDGRVRQLVLVHPSTAADADAAAGPFALVERPRGDSALVREICRRAGRLGAAFRWDFIAQPPPSGAPDVRKGRVEDLELLALEIGLKPVVRQSIVPGSVRDVLARFEELGLEWLTGQRLLAFGGHEYVLVYASRSMDLCVRASNAEDVLIARRGRGKAAATRDLGLCLGYPVCCVEAFCELVGYRAS